MGRGLPIVEIERNLIKKPHNEGKKYREISKIVGCSENMVTTAVKLKKNQRNMRQKKENHFEN